MDGFPAWNDRRMIVRYLFGGAVYSCYLRTHEHEHEKQKHLDSGR